MSFSHASRLVPIPSIAAPDGTAGFRVEMEEDSATYAGAVILERRCEGALSRDALTPENARRLANDLLVGAARLEVARRQASGDGPTEDVIAFGEEAWVHCDSHGRPHKTGWCTVPPEKKTLLDARSQEAAIAECRRRGLWLYEDQEKGRTEPSTPAS